MADQDVATKADIAELRAELGAELRTGLADLRIHMDRFMQIVADEFTTTRNRIAEVERHLEIIDRRMDRLGDGVATMARWAESFDRVSNLFAGNQAGQQRVIDDLVQRVTRLEQRLQGTQ